MKQNEFVTGDTHFGHKAAVRYEWRPWTNVEEMDDALIEAWNRKVPARGAIVYHLGDFSFHGREETESILIRLHGTIRLIRGNHDRGILKSAIANKFEWVKDYYESKSEAGTKIVMCHYPMVTWNQAHYGSWMLHGHSHGNLADAGVRRMDVGVETHPNFEPYDYDEVCEFMQNRRGPNVDHHKDKT
jgi:calcineurin-like phosphoesterase family protein